jgi:prolyl-tRNA synthetase
VVRPTSETIIGAAYSRWIQSYRDLPILINQWANVVRWELRPRLFLRTAEFLWQEGHTAHSTEQEAREETRQMLDVYANFAENYMAMPVIKGEKTAGERFPGAVSTLCIEAMMQDRKALQAGTSHFLGQNFSRAQQIKFQDQNGDEVYAWTTSWGVSTRLIGAVLMTHSDDDGLVLPPRLAPKHVVILPIYRDDQRRQTVIEYCEKLKDDLQLQPFHGGPIKVMIDDRDLRGGEKNWQHIKRGVPVRIEIGPRDVASDSVLLQRRDRSPRDKDSVSRAECVSTVPQILADMQEQLYQRAQKLMHDHTHVINDLDQFRDFFTPANPNRPEIHGGFALAHWSEGQEMEEILRPLKVTVRCVPLGGDGAVGKCIFTGRPSQSRAVFAKAY